MCIICVSTSAGRGHQSYIMWIMVLELKSSGRAHRALTAKPSRQLKLYNSFWVFLRHVSMCSFHCPETHPADQP